MNGTRPGLFANTSAFSCRGYCSGGTGYRYVFREKGYNKELVTNMNASMLSERGVDHAARGTPALCVADHAHQAGVVP